MGRSLLELNRLVDDVLQTLGRMVAEAEERAEIAFENHDWDADPIWKAKLSQVYFSNASDQILTLIRLKRKYFKAEINSDLSLNAIKPKSASKTSDSNEHRATGFDFRRKLCIGVNYTCLLLHAFNLLATAGLVHLLGVLEFRLSDNFDSLMISSTIVSLLQIFVKYGTPRANRTYAQLALADEQSHFVIMYFSMLFAHPMFLAIAPACIRSVLFISVSLNQAILPLHFPQHHRRILPVLNLIQDKHNYLTDWLSQLDVAVGFILVLSLFTSARQPIVALLFWQYLRIRYMFSSSGKAALQNAGRTLDGYLLHPRSPQIVQKIYSKIVALAYSTVDAEQAKARYNQFQSAKRQFMNETSTASER